MPATGAIVDRSFQRFARSSECSPVVSPGEAACSSTRPGRVVRIENPMARVFGLSGIFGFESTSTVYTRVNRLALSDGLVGFAIDALREAFWGEHADRLILIGYEALAKKPDCPSK